MNYNVPLRGFKDEVLKYIHTPQKVERLTLERVNDFLSGIEYRWQNTEDDEWADLYSEVIKFKIHLLRMLYSPNSTVSNVWNVDVNEL